MSEGKRREASPRRRNQLQASDSYSAQGLALVVNGMLVGVGGVFMATSSVMVTVVAAGAALVLTLLIMRRQR